MNSKPKMVKSVNGPGVQNGNQDGGIRLSLRVHRLEQEIRDLQLSDDVKDLMEGALSDRQMTFECKYRQVCRWIEMQKHGSFWQDFGCKSLDELWARLDLPGGAALANWELLVRLFDKETFLLVGDDGLGYMTRYVATFQPDIEARKTDYQKIFDEYCKQYSAFDISSFRRHVNWYINHTYVTATLDLPIDKSKAPPRKVGKGIFQRKTVVMVEPAAQVESLIAPSNATLVIHEPRSVGRPRKDFAIIREQCGGCKERNSALTAAMSHVVMLEEYIRRNIGPKFVPARPSVLSDLEITELIK